jgi:hypothetical protein
MRKAMKKIHGSVLFPALIGLLLVAGCAELDQDVREIRDYMRKLRGKDPAPPPPAPPSAAEMPAVAAAGLNLAGNCVGKEETGYAENVRVTVAGGQVRALDARIDIPKHGSCRYQLADFRQTKQTPFVELVARSNSACAVRMWQQGDRITLAATDCEEKCARGAFEYAWPVEFTAGGACY